MKSFQALLAAVVVASPAFVAAQNQAPPPDPSAAQNPAIKSPNDVGPGPLRAGRNSFTRGEAQARLRKAGYTKITNLTLSPDGLWQAQAMHDGKQVSVSLDFKGTVSAQ